MREHLDHRLGRIKANKQFLSTDVETEAGVTERLDSPGRS